MGGGPGLVQIGRVTDAPEAQVQDTREVREHRRAVSMPVRQTGSCVSRDLDRLVEIRDQVRCGEAFLERGAESREDRRAGDVPRRYGRNRRSGGRHGLVEVAEVAADVEAHA